MEPVIVDTQLASTQTLQGELVLASDLHVREPEEHRARLLVDLIDRIDGATAYFVLNGDVFDFYFGAGAYFRRKYAAIGAALERLSARGTRVLFIEGNHEFHMHEAGWQQVEIVTTRDLVLPLPSGTRVKITHGDLLSDDPLYRMFRALIKSQAVRAGAKLLPGAWLDAYAMRHASISRSRDKYRTLDHQKILANFSQWLVTAPTADHGIIGHFHVPYAEPHPHGGLMVSVASWDQPSVLVFRDRRFWRAHLNEVGAAFQLTTARPLQF